MKAPTLPKVRAMVARANGLRVADVRVTWAERPRRVTFPTGIEGYVARVAVEADGFRARTMLVSADAGGVAVR